MGTNYSFGYHIAAIGTIGKLKIGKLGAF